MKRDTSPNQIPMEFLLEWEGRMQTKVVQEYQNLASGASFSVAVERIHSATAAELRDFLTEKERFSELLWIEVLVWAEGLHGEGKRQALFSRSLAKKTDRREKYQKWLYEDFFRDYYEKGFKNIQSISQLHYEHGVTKDFLFHFFKKQKIEISYGDEFFWKHFKGLSELSDSATAAQKLNESLRKIYDLSREDKSSWAPVQQMLDDELGKYIKQHARPEGHAGYEKLCKEYRVLKEEVDKAWEKTAKSRQGLSADGTDKKALPLEEIDKTILAGVFLLNFFFTSFIHDNRKTPIDTFTYFLRSEPELTSARRAGLLPRTLEASLIFATSRELDQAQVKGLKLLCRITQRVLAEIISAGFMEQRVTASAMRAATAAIFARNMSHNIGSHVLPRARVDQIEKRVREMWTGKGELMSWQTLPIAAKLKTQLDNYIRQKADFLAELTTEPLSSTSTMLLYRDVVLPMLMNTVLMDCIASNEGFRYRSWSDSPLQLRFFSDLDENASSELTPESTEGEDLRTIPYGHGRNAAEHKDLSVRIKGARGTGDDSDIAVALPGALGQFAIYGIIENLLRNSAKHNRRTLREEAGQNLILTLRLKQDACDASAYRMLIYDNVSDPAAINGRDGKELHEILQGQLEEPIIEKTGEVRPRAWGLAEIMICANLLAGSASYSYQKPSIRIRKMSEEALGEPATEHVDRLVFDIKLLRARQVLLCGKNLMKNFRGLGSNKAWDKYGIVGVKDAEELLSRLASPDESPAAFQFVVLGEVAAKELLPEPGQIHSPANAAQQADRDARQEGIRAQLPFRIIRKGHSNRTTDFGDVEVSDFGWGKQALDPTPANVDSILHTFWQIWCRHWSGSSDGGGPAQSMVAVHLDHASDAWKKHAKAFSETEKKSPSPLILRVTPSDAKLPIISKAGNVQASIFDRHGGATNNGLLGSSSSSYVAFDKLSNDFLSIFEPRFPRDKTGGNWSFPLELFEAGQLRVLIVDERLAERSLTSLDKTDLTLFKLPAYVPPFPANTTVDSLCMWHVAYAARTYIATHVLFEQSEDGSHARPEALAKNALHRFSYAARAAEYCDGGRVTCPRLEIRLYGEKPTLVGYALGPDKKEGAFDVPAVDILVIHQGVLDRKKDGDSRPLLDLIKPIAKWVVVESGRGVPPEVQSSNEKFLPFSALDQCFGDSRIAKLTLCKQLMERARRKVD